MKLIHILAIMAIEALLLCAGVSVASRNSSGTMSGINGPYTAGSVISSSVINARFSDIETELTDSASRSGKGGFTAPVRGADGTVTAPTFSFTSETGTGLYRIGSSDLGVAINQSKKLELTGSLFTVTPAASFSSTLSTTGLITATVAAATAIKALSGAAGSATDITIGRTAFEGRLGVAAAGNNYASGSVAGDIILGTSGGNLWLDTNTGSGTPSLKVVAANGGVIVAGGLTIGSSGTAISLSQRASQGGLSPSAVTGATCASVATLAVTGATVGTECAVGTTDTHANLIYKCAVTSSTGCQVYACNITAVNITPDASETVTCRVFNP